MVKCAEFGCEPLHPNRARCSRRTRSWPRPHSLVVAALRSSSAGDGVKQALPLNLPPLVDHDGKLLFQFLHYDVAVRLSRNGKPFEDSAKQVAIFGHAAQPKLHKIVEAP